MEGILKNNSYRKYILATGIFVATLAFLVLLGWLFNIPVFKSIVPGYVNMKFNTALGLFVTSVAFLFYVQKPYGVVAALARICVAFILVLATITLLQIFTGNDYGIDRLFITDTSPVSQYDTAGRMSPITGVCFVLVCTSILLLSAKNEITRQIVQGMLHIVTLLSFIAIVGYLLGVPTFYRLAVLATMAVHTAIAFFVFSIGLSLVNPEVGITGMFTGSKLGNVMARRVFLQSLVTVLVLAYIRILAHRYFLVSVEFGIALFALSFILTTLFILWRTANEINALSVEKEIAEHDMNMLAAFLDSTPDPVVVTDSAGVIKLVNHRVETVFGFSKNQIAGEHLSKLIPLSATRLYAHFKGAATIPGTGTGNYEIELRGTNNNIKWVDVRLNKVGFADDAFVTVSIQDITARKRAENQLSELSSRLTMATTGSGIGIWEYKLNDDLLVWDELMYNIYGISTSVFDNTIDAWLANVVTEDRVKVKLALKGAINDGEEFGVEFGLINGKYVKSRAGLQRDIEGNITGLLGVCWDITQRKQIEKELVLSYERNRIFVEQAPNAIAMFDTDMHYLAASRKWIDDYRLEGQEIIGRSHYDVFPEIGDDWKAIHQECLKGAVNRTDASPFERADGTVQWLTWDVRPWYVTEGQIGGLLMYTADITAVKRTDAEKLRIEKILSRTNQIARIATWEVDGKNGNAVWSNNAYDIWELPNNGQVPERDVILGMYKEASRIKLLDAISSQISNGSSYDLELEFTSGKGNHKWIRLIADADFENGFCKRRFGVFQDITDTKLAGEALAKANEELQAIFNSGYVSIISADVNGLITNFNHGAEILLQYTAAEMVGKQTPYIIHVAEEVQKRSEELTQIYGRPIEGFNVFIELARLGKYESREWTYVRKDGSRFPVQLIVSSIRNSAGEITGYLGVATDITERKHAEEKLRNYSILESKSKEMEQFAYIASHDLREPLLTIKSFAKLLDEEYGTTFDEDGRIYINAIIKSITRMEALTKGLLDYSRLGQIKPMEKVDCNAVLNDVVADLNALITTTGATVVVDKLPVVNGHALELKLLFQNLLNNAIKFRKKDIAPVVQISAKPTADGYLFAVEDNGIGISEKSREKIFVMFQRLHNRDLYEGTGIGLAQCKKIVEMHNGTIWVESEPDKYSRFCFIIST